MGYPPRPLGPRLEAWSVPEPNSGCFLWLGGLSGDGYGKSWYRGKGIRAHRLAWIAAKGSVPPETQVLHKCDTPLCVNPEHLFLGTHLDNMRDASKKGRLHGKPPRKIGEAHPAAKLTEQQVLEIRASGIGCRIAARMYGVTSDHILHIRSGRKWRHLPLGTRSSKRAL